MTPHPSIEEEIRRRRYRLLREEIIRRRSDKLEEKMREMTDAELLFEWAKISTEKVSTE